MSDSDLSQCWSQNAHFMQVLAMQQELLKLQWTLEGNLQGAISAVSSCCCTCGLAAGVQHVSQVVNAQNHLQADQCQTVGSASASEDKLVA